MANAFKSLDLQLLDQNAGSLGPGSTRPAWGWARAVREGLGMTRAQLAARVGLSAPTIQTLETNEARGAITVESLEKLARGLGGRLVYAIVPPEGMTFEQMVRDRAEAIAKTRLERVAHSMSLEAQSVEKRRQEAQLGRLVDRLLSGSRRKLWD